MDMHENLETDATRPTGAPARPAPAGLVALLVVVSLLLGGVANWGWTQRQQYRQARFSLDISMGDLALLQARQADAAALLVDADTRLLRFAADDSAISGGPEVVVAWNARTARGAVVTDWLVPPPAGHGYWLWLHGDDAAALPRAVASLDAATAWTIRPFQIPSAESADVPLFRITLEPLPVGAAPAGRVLYRTVAPGPAHSGRASGP